MSELANHPLQSGARSPLAPRHPSPPPPLSAQPEMSWVHWRAGGRSPSDGGAAGGRPRNSQPPLPPDGWRWRAHRAPPSTGVGHPRGSGRGASAKCHVTSTGVRPDTAFSSAALAIRQGVQVSGDSLSIFYLYLHGNILSTD